MTTIHGWDVSWQPDVGLESLHLQACSTEAVLECVRLLLRVDIRRPAVIEIKPMTIITNG